MGLLGGYIFTGISVPKLGTIEEAADFQNLTEYMEYQANIEDAGARYPSRLVPSHEFELLWVVPVKSVYFLFSPFPWDLSNPKHFIGLVDAFFYLAMAILLWRNRRSIWVDPGGKALLLMSLAMVIVFGVGTGNFGTALRHRAKFVAALIVLAAPRLPRLVFHGRFKTGSTEPVGISISCTNPD
jgi:hypothetical protein